MPAMQRTRAPLAAAAAALLLAACSASTPTPTPPPEATATASAAPSVEPELLDRRWTVLFVGTDLNEARANDGATASTDALMLASLSADASRLALVSLPRDTVDVPLPGGGTWDRKINALYASRGIDALAGAMETLYSVPINGHLVLDMDDFTRLVDAVGGVEVAPEEPLTDPIVNLDLDAGPQEIDAVTANGYVRTRVDQDYGRMARQQEVLLGIAERLVDPENDLDLRAFLENLESLETDLPLEELPTLLELARRAADAELDRLVIGPPDMITFEGDRGDGRGYVLEPGIDAIRAEVRELVGD